jgi:hypothetical protein
MFFSFEKFSSCLKKDERYTLFETTGMNMTESLGIGFSRVYKSFFWWGTGEFSGSGHNQPWETQGSAVRTPSKVARCWSQIKTGAEGRDCSLFSNFLPALRHRFKQKV